MSEDIGINDNNGALIADVNFADDNNNALKAESNSASQNDASIDESANPTQDLVDTDNGLNQSKNPLKSNNGLTVTKTIDNSSNHMPVDGFYDIGDTIYYTINITNNLEESIGNISVVENFPDGLIWEYIWFADDNPNWKNESNVFNYTKALEPEHSILLKIRMTGNKTGTYINTINVSSNLTSSQEFLSEEVTVYAPNLTITKVANDPIVTIGEIANFTINVTNNGNRPLSNLRIYEDPEESLFLNEFTNISGNWDSFAERGSNYGFSLDQLDIGESAAIIVSFLTTEIGNFTNKVYSNYPNPQVEANATVTVVPRIEKTVNATEIDMGESVEYNVYIDMTGANKLGIDDFKIKVTDILNEYFDLDKDSISSNWKYNRDEKAFEYMLSDIPESFEFNFAVYITERGNYTNTVSLKIGDLPEVSAESDVTHVRISDANITETAINSIVNLQEQAVFIVNVTNTGDKAFNPSEIFVNDDYDEDGLAYLSHEDITGKWIENIETDSLSFTLNSTLEVGESASFKVYFNTSKVGSYSNYVYININDKEDDSIVIVLALMNKSVNSREIDAGDSVEYNIFINLSGYQGPVKVEDLFNDTFALDKDTISENWHYDETENAFIFDLSDNPDTLNLSFNVTINEKGNYTNLAKLILSSDYPEITAEAPEVCVYKADMTVTKTVNDTEIYIGDTVKYTVTIDNTGDRTLTNIIVKDDLDPAFILDESSITEGWTYNKDNSSFTYNNNISVGESAILEFIVEISKEGKYTNIVNVSSPGVANKEARSEETVAKTIPTNICLENVTADPESFVIIYINITADKGLINGRVKITFPDGTNETEEIINGNGYTVWYVPDNYASGNYSVFAYYEGNGTYLESEGQGNIEVIPYYTEISLSNVTAYPDSDVEIEINITAGDAKLINGTVTVSFPDGTNKTAEIINGTGNVNWTVPDDYKGNYSISASYPGGGNYLDSNATANIEVIAKISTQITADIPNAYPGEEIDISVNVTADNDVPFNGNITVNLPDGSKETVEIKDGKGNIAWTVPDNLDVGDYNLTLTFDGDNNYLPSNATSTLTVEKIKLLIIIDNITAHPKEDVTISVNVAIDDGSESDNSTKGSLSDSNANKALLKAYISSAKGILSSNPLNDGDNFNGYVNITLPDNSTVEVQVKDGKAALNWTVPEGYEGEYPIKVTFNGNGKYLSASETGYITIEKIPTSIDLENIGTKPNREIIIPITIKTDDDVPFNGKVSVELPDGTIQTAEITEGIGNTTWTVPDDYKGEYNYTVRFDGDGTYLPSNNTAIIKVDSKIQVEIIVGNITAKPKDKVTIPIEVITEEESLFNGNVTVILPDGTEVTAQIINGEGSVEWTVPEDYNGTYSVSVRFDGDDTFLEADGTGFITVTPETPDNPVTPISPVSPDNPVAPAKHSANKQIPMDKTAPGNPIMALLIVLSSLIFVRRSRK